MTVGELIEKLLKLDPALRVVTKDMVNGTDDAYGVVVGTRSWDEGTVWVE